MEDIGTLLIYCLSVSLAAAYYTGPFLKNIISAKRSLLFPYLPLMSTILWRG